MYTITRGQKYRKNTEEIGGDKNADKATKHEQDMTENKKISPV